MKTRKLITIISSLFVLFMFTSSVVPLVPKANAAYGAIPWWSGNCDDSWYYSQSGVHAYALGASYQGYIACGPMPSNGAKDVPVTIGGFGEYEWECTELAFRYMNVAFSQGAYSAFGKDVINNYSQHYSGPLVQMTNGSASSAPSAGDIISFYNPNNSSDPGHVAIIQALTYDGSGNLNGATLLEQNNNTDSTGGGITLSVSHGGNGWSIGNLSSTRVTSGWLHNPTTGYIAGINPPSGVKQIFGVNSSGQVTTNWQSGGGWAGWHVLNSGTTIFPIYAHLGVTMNQSGSIELFATDTRGHFWHMWGSQGSWSGWNQLDGQGGASDITAGNWDNNNDMVLWMTVTDTHPYYRYSTNGSWSAWIAYNGTNGLTSASFPLRTRYIIGRDPSSVNVVAIAGDGKMYSNYAAWGTHNWQSSFGVFGDLVNGQGFIAEPKSFIRDNSGNEDIVAPRGDGTVWQNWESGGSWQGWSQVSSSPQIKTQITGANSLGSPEFYSRSVNFYVYHNWNTGCGTCFSGWNLFSSNIPFYSDPNAISNSSNYPEIFTTASDGNVYHQWLYSSGGTLYWSGWQNLGGMG